MRFTMLLGVLAAARVIGAAFYIVHDCDEVFNYWEPLHFLVNGTGMQTWEYSSRYALRPYLYLLVHWPVAKVASMLTSPGLSSSIALYAVRSCLAMMSWVLESRMLRATWHNCSPTAATTFAVLLAFSTGTFFAPAALLPSTFSMYCMVSATTGILNGNAWEVILAAVLGTVLGWSPAAVAFAPFAVWLLCSPRLARSFGVLVASLAVVVPLVAVTDWYFYGRPTVSVVNFLQYNVAGGGESALYGVEPASFYVFNGLLNFGVALPASLAFIVIAALSAARLTSARTSARECAAMAPLFVMFPALLALPHKEERFLAVLYPQITLGAALAVAAAPRLVSDVLIHTGRQESRDAVRHVTGVGAACLVALSCVMTTSRSFALIQFFGAPTQAWHLVSTLQSADLPPAGPNDPLRACVGAEWHRYASSFFLPTGVELAFVEFGETGQLPKAFEANGLGTRAAPEELRDRNEKDDRLLLSDTSSCSIWVGTSEQAQPTPDTAWAKVFEADFVDREQSPFPDRAFWIPWRPSRNYLVKYSVFVRRAATMERTVSDNSDSHDS